MPKVSIGAVEIFYDEAGSGPPLMMVPGLGGIGSIWAPQVAAFNRDALAKDHDLMRAKGIDAVLAKHKLDALVVLTNGPAHMTDLVNGDRDTGGSSSLAAVAGYPSITLPAGWIDGLPVGISFIGKAWSEPELVKLAFGLEQALGMRKAAALKPTADIPFSGLVPTISK